MGEIGGDLDHQDATRRGSSSPKKSRRLLVAGLSLLGLLVAMAVFAPLLTPYDPNQLDLVNAFLPMSREHLLGTDQLGRDVWTRMLFAGRADLRIAALGIIAPFILGTAVGLLSSYRGGRADTLMMRVTDVVIAFPFLVLIMALVFVMGSGETSIYLAIAIVGWVSYARIIRGEVLVEKEKDYALAARVAGLSTWRILRRHILPNVITQPMLFAMSDMVFIILAIVTLGFFGLGLPPPTAEWGAMIQEGYPFLLNHWELATFPGFAIVLTALALSLIGDALADRFSG